MQDRKPTANIYRERGYYRVVLNVGAMKLIDSKEICFDSREMAIRLPTIYDSKVYRIGNRKVNNAAFVFTDDSQEEQDLVGKYVIEQDGDEFFFTKR